MTQIDLNSDERPTMTQINVGTVEGMLQVAADPMLSGVHAAA
jgi:hypothetical protein